MSMVDLGKMLSRAHDANEENDTIVAISTPPGQGGVGIIRISGNLSKKIAQKITKKEAKNREAIYTKFYYKNNEILDEGLLLYFKNPHSFTGDDVIEFQIHGSPVILDQLLQLSMQYGARLAKPGEFSERAFLNGKIDLTQAEAIADLIQSTSLYAAKLATKSLTGNFSNYIRSINNQIIYLRTYIEASIDFSEEEIDVLSDKKIKEKLKTALTELENLIIQAEQSVVYQEGMTLVIAGEPNVGKSSLLNQLSGEEKAIVTEIAGTTRDIIKTEINCDGIPLHIIDTAGLRESDDIIEQEGIRRAITEIEKADKILFLIDGERKNKIEDLLKNVKNIPPIMMVKNKIDLTEEKPRIAKENGLTTVYLSAKTGDGIDLLKQQLKIEAGLNKHTECQFLARRRHLAALNQAKEYLYEAERQFNHRIIELLAENLRLAQEAISQITGEFTTEDLLSQIFSTFCVGK
jgi:tRNA modification GTPase